MKISIKKYILYSSVFSIFTEEFFFKFIIDWKLLYLIIFTNFILLLKIKKITLNIYFVLLLLFFFVHGILCYGIIGIPINYMLSQIIGIGIVGAYFYNFIPLYSKEEITKVYLKLSLIIAVIGYVLYVVNFNKPSYRLMSIFREPAHYSIVVIPACFYFLKEKKYYQFAIIFGTLLLSNSSLGYIGCALMFIVPNVNVKRIGYLVMLIPIILISFLYLYNNFSFFKLRFDDTYNSINVINTGKFDEKTNLSSYVMIANLHIAKENISDHPFGSGIGSHHHMHTQRYLKAMRPPKYLVVQNRHVDNSFDANSLFTRMASEFGVFGILFVFYCLYLAVSCFKYDDFLAQGIFVYFLLKLFRDGHYFPPELFFFIWIFYFSLKNNKVEKVDF